MESDKYDKYNCIRLENQICFPMYACAKEVVRQYRKPLEKLGLTYTQYVVMMVLWEFGGMTEGELGRKVYLDSGTLAPLLKRMEKQGHITRIRPEANQRKLFVELTAAGNALKDQAINNFSLVGTSVWRYFGQNMVLFIGAIMSVDGDLYEAAMLDGANKTKQFFYVILPNIKTIVVLNVILSITGSLSAFEPPYVITDGANGTGTYFVIMHEIAHTQQKVGLASAMAVVLLAIILFATLLQRLFFKFVFKDAEDEISPRKRAKLKARMEKAAAANAAASLKGGMRA